MQDFKIIEHQGVIKEIDDNMVKVSILSKSSCTSCQVKGACSVSEIEEKIIDIKCDTTQYKKGEIIDVYYKQSLGFRALFLGYILPFLIVLFSLIIIINLGYSEGIAGLSSILLLIPYYLALYLIRKKLKETFSFSIKKINR